MGRAIVISITIVVLVMLIIGAAMWATREQRGVGFTPRQERARQRLLNRAHQILSEAGPGRTIEDSDVLSSRTSAARDEWLNRYHDLKNKEI